MDTILPLVDALYSIHMDDKAFKHSIEFGVLHPLYCREAETSSGGRPSLYGTME
ncbi:hypothetical protein [Thermococcus sp.]